jgi:hypothetical protein
MFDKQNFNGKIGEARTDAILSENFAVSKRTPDIDGADFIVEIPFDSIKEFRDFKERGIVQAKFFEYKNEVKIAKHYVEDHDGIRTNFFALIHSNTENEDEVCYFFTANQIKKEFRLRKDEKTSKDYFVFSLTKKRKFSKYRDLSKATINRKIREGILLTDEYSSQKLINELEQKYKNPRRLVYENNNKELFDLIKDKHIIDKLYTSLNTYKNFRRITSWRLIDKISFYKKVNTSTYYNAFSLVTNNQDILDFFSNLIVKKDIKIKNEKEIKNVEDAKYKINNIISTLNNNLITKVEDNLNNTSFSIQIRKTELCNCIYCLFKRLDFKSVVKNSVLKTDQDDLWDSLKEALTLINIGRYEDSKILLYDISIKSKESKDHIVYFFTKYNQIYVAHKTWDDSMPNLQIELELLDVSADHYSILDAIRTNALINDYSNSIDEIYSKIKDFKQRRSINDTDSLIRRFYFKYIEYVNFIEGNYIVSYNEHKVITEKLIESLIISYSMNDKLSNHLNEFNDFMVQSAIHNCEPSNLLKYFQRNNVNQIPYNSETNYLEISISNFFSIENIEFLESEIIYIDNRTKNPDLKRLIGNIFANICIFITYLKLEIDKNLLSKIILFIEKLDFSSHELYILAHPLLKKPKSFQTTQILTLIEILIEKKITDGYLISNSLITLHKKKYSFTKSNKQLLNSIIKVAIVKSGYGILKNLINIISEEDKEYLSLEINESLNVQFNPELFFQATINNSIKNPELHLNKYLDSYQKIISGKPNIFFRNLSRHTGIAYNFSNPLNKLVIVIYHLNDKKILNNGIIKEIKKIHPYYNFILHLENHPINKDFDINWFLENPSKIILQRLAKFDVFAVKIKEELSNNYNEDLSKLYIKYFS